MRHAATGASKRRERLCSSTRGGVRRPVLHQLGLTRPLGSTDPAVATEGAPSQAGNDWDGVYDVAVLGSGPAACSLAALLGAHTGSGGRGLKVVLVSAKAQERWVPNYGAWTEEWAALDAAYGARGVPGLMEMGVDTQWGDTDCFFGENEDEKVTSNPEGNYRRTLGREYLRVSRKGLKDVFFGDGAGKGYEVVASDVAGRAINTNVFAPQPGSIALLPHHTELTLNTGGQIKARVVVDACGAESPFTIRDEREKEGYQIAYGVECRVKGSGVTAEQVGDYSRTKMTLFDYRSEAWRNTATGSSVVSAAQVVAAPTFNYVMPLRDDVIFFEETSLVANPAVSFQDCKERLRLRLLAMGVEVSEVLEEEFCYIPMGGATPRRGQRLVPVGAAAGVVHPSTGYQLCRALASNLAVASAIVQELEGAAAAGGEAGDEEKGAEGARGFDPDAAAARVVASALWTAAAQRQRAFATFGGDFLMAQDVEGLKGFFSGFFKLDTPVWAGFLAGWKGLPNNEHHATWSARLVFGVVFLTKLPLRIGAAMALAIAQYTLREGTDLLQSVTPLFGDPPTYDSGLAFKDAAKGDPNAKQEARAMISEAAAATEAQAE